MTNDEETQRLTEFNAMLIRDNERLKKAGNAMAAAGLLVTTEYDGVHRLALTVAEWAKAVADEGDRGTRHFVPVELRAFLSEPSE